MGPRLLLNIREAYYNYTPDPLNGSRDCSLTATVDHSIRFAGGGSLPECEGDGGSRGLVIELE